MKVSLISFLYCVSFLVLQVIEGNDATRMLYCHDGTHTVVVHLMPRALDRYRAGFGIGFEPNSEDQAAAPLSATLNSIGRNRGLISISDWRWSITPLCTAWLRGGHVESGNLLAMRSSPLCIQANAICNVGSGLQHSIFDCGLYPQHPPTEINLLLLLLLFIYFPFIIS